MTVAVDPDLLAKANALLAEHPVLDGHNDLPYALRKQVGYRIDERDIAKDQSAYLHTDLPRLRAGGVGAQFWSVYVPSKLQRETAVTATLEQIDCVLALAARYPDALRLTNTADEVRTAWADGRIASLMGAEGGHSIGCSLATLRAMYALGVRYMTLTHNDNVPWADAATDEPAVGGLTRFGEEVVREMNRLGMLVDLSHVAPDTMRAALRVSRAPVIFSHSSSRAVCDHVRNIPDDVLATLPGNGGVAMATFVPMFVTPAASEWMRGADGYMKAHGMDPLGTMPEAMRVLAEYEADHPRPVATVSDVADHVDHMREVAGIDHIGLGGDYDGTAFTPSGLEDVSSYPNLLAELMRRGWSTADLGKLTSGNALRVLGAAEDVARELSRTEAPSVATIEELDAK